MSLSQAALALWEVTGIAEPRVLQQLEKLDEISPEIPPPAAIGPAASNAILGYARLRPLPIQRRLRPQPFAGFRSRMLSPLRLRFHSPPLLHNSPLVQLCGFRVDGSRLA